MGSVVSPALVLSLDIDFVVDGLAVDLDGNVASVHVPGGEVEGLECDLGVGVLLLDGLEGHAEVVLDGALTWGGQSHVAVGPVVGAVDLNILEDASELVVVVLVDPGR